MKNVLISGSSICAVVLFVFSACSSTNRGSDKQAGGGYPVMVYYLDVVGDDALETLIVSQNEANPEIRDIFIVKDGVMDRIISVKPWGPVWSVLSQNPKEVIYLQVNEPGTGEKGLRIIIRTIAQSPDHLFIDLFYDDYDYNGWIVKRYYLLNTDARGPIKLFIESVCIGLPVEDVFGEKLLCDPRFDIDIVHFANTASKYRIE
jgi:hypothetical protein